MNSPYDLAKSLLADVDAARDDLPNAAQATSLAISAAEDALLQMRSALDGLRRHDQLHTAMRGRLGDLVAALKPPLPTYRAGLPWRSGYRQAINYPDKALTDVRAFEQWRGRPVDVVDLFIGQDTFNKPHFPLANGYIFGNSLIQGYIEAGYTVALAVPLMPTIMARDYASVASGALDVPFQTLITKLVPIIGDRLIYIRLGWEADEGYPWSWTEAKATDSPDTAQTEAEYRVAWGRIAWMFKQQLPGCRMVWNVLRNTRRAAARYYPSDEAVDVVGMDVYDNGSGGFCTADTWNTWKGGFDPAAGVFRGPQGALDFAKSRGKKVSFCEWGCSNKAKLAVDGSNSPNLPTMMWAFLNENAEFVEYEVYFQNGSAQTHQIFPPIEHNAQVSEAYLKHWTPA